MLGVWKGDRFVHFLGVFGKKNGGSCREMLPPTMWFWVILSDF